MIRTTAVAIAAMATLFGGSAWALAAAQPAPAPAPAAAEMPRELGVQPSRKSQRRRHASAADAVMRDGDTVSLIARLPWWRADGSPSNEEQNESPVLTACDLWLGSPRVTIPANSLTLRLAAAAEAVASAPQVPIADPNQVNEIDLMAPDPPHSSGGTWLGALAVILGGALAALSTRFLSA